MQKLLNKNRNFEKKLMVQTCKHLISNSQLYFSKASSFFHVSWVSHGELVQKKLPFCSSSQLIAKESYFSNQIWKASTYTKFLRTERGKKPRRFYSSSSSSSSSVIPLFSSGSWWWKRLGTGVVERRQHRVLLNLKPKRWSQCQLGPESLQLSPFSLSIFWITL